MPFSLGKLFLLAGAAAAVPTEMSLLKSRDETCVSTLSGNGDPHKDYLHKQVSDVIQCAGSTCSVTGITGTQEFTIKSGDTSQGQPIFTDGGLGAKESYNIINNYSCQADGNDKVCVWVNIEHIGYTINGMSNDGGSCHASGEGSIVIDAPTGEATYYCVFGDSCRNLGDAYWCFGADGVSDV